MANRESIIEQATKRLEELRRSGVSVPAIPSGVSRSTQHDVARLPHRDAARAGMRHAELPRTPESLNGSGLPIGARFPDQTLVSADSSTTHSPTVEIDLVRLGRMGYLVHEEDRSVLASEFRHIKRPLLRNVDRELDGAANRSSLIMVTSAIAGEGKTFCSINLAMSIAMEVDTSVLLVDADVVRPAVLERLGLSPLPGLLDVLSGEVGNLDDVILHTNVPKLSILPAGAPRAMATELLASTAMDKLLLGLATRRADRVVVLDAPPLLLTTESPVLASRVGQVVIVVDSERTSAQKVAQAFATVEGCPIVLSLLNKCGVSMKGDAYGYAY